MKGPLPSYEKCFFCGPATGGLALGIEYREGSAFAEFTAQEKFQGYDGVLHGGIVTGVLDEVMWWTLFMETRVVAATWKIDVEFRRPIKCGNVYYASAELLCSNHGNYYMSAVIEDKAKKVAARAGGMFRKTKGFTMEEMVKHLNFRGVSEEVRSLFST
ncbi:MAG: PaaI family thioesterase [Syntrophobacterales bacterium]|jgi:acyl-coenzyme A thioesterase PaaI-like protein|nr:PaaI family thioesterase [Syntrophobacterales bacterium]